jgi:hypothetical protein
VSVDTAELLVDLSLELPRRLAKTDIGDRLAGAAIVIFERFPDSKMTADAA